MSDDRTPSEQRAPLSVQSLRELMREARGGFVPDHVGAALRHHFPRMVESDAGELAEMLRPLIAAAHERLKHAGIEPVFDEHASPARLSKRERDYVTNIAALVTFQCDVLTHACRLDDAIGVGMEALAWCRAAGDRLQESVAWRALSSIYRALQRFDAQENACRRALEAARASGVAGEIIEVLDFLTAFLVVRGRYDEAETMNEETLALLKEMPDARRYYPSILLDSARIKVYRADYADGIRILREALRWCDHDTDPAEQASVVAYLGKVYLRLGDYRQCIECHHESIRLADAGGSEVIRGWGYFHLAEAHYRLKEIDAAEEMLRRTEECASRLVPSLMQAVIVKRMQICAENGRLEDAVALCQHILDDIDGASPAVQIFANRTLADIAVRRQRYDDAEKHLRAAIDISTREPSLTTPGLQISLARTLHTLDRDEEVRELLDTIASSKGMNQEEEIQVLRLRASIAEKNEDLAEAIEFERRAFEIERTLLERRMEESLRNARIIAEADLLEREAELERERRRRLEHELAEAIVGLGDHRRIAAEVEERLCAALDRAAGGDEERAATTVLKETLHELRSRTQQQESPLKYLSGVDEAFYRRLRERCPDLTSKQERLCGLLRAGLGSKEIAVLLELEVEGLKAQRKRLRKRLGLAPDVRLETILAEL